MKGNDSKKEVLPSTDISCVVAYINNTILT